VQADVSDPVAVEAMVESAVDRHGGVDVLVNNVGVGRSGRVHELAIDDWQFALDATLSSVFYGAKYAIPHMLQRGGGAIVNIASVQGLVAHRRSAAYNAAKGGVINLTRNIALDYGADGIRCNAICPGAIESHPLADRAEAMASRQIEYPEARTIEEVQAMHALGRVGTPDEIASVAAFLVSDEASFMTGAAVVADGGLTVQVLA
jgi:NAD(P)-dependent dehydrogenase (short-subunit alcohol dehydrogenase family)